MADVGSVLPDLLEDYANEGFHPQVVIIDYIGFPALENADIFACRERMKAVSQTLKTLAQEFRFFGIGFCQIDAEHKNELHLDPNAISECKTLSTSADGFLAISHVYGEDTDPLPYRPIQQVTVSIKGAKPYHFPIRTNFAFQRFEDLQNPHKPAARWTEHCEITQSPLESPRAQLVATNRGFMPMSRERLEALFEYGNRNSVNVYCFLALAAKYQGIRGDKGTSYWGREQMGDRLGLTEKAIRCALDRLIASEFIAPEGRYRRAVIYRVIDWARWHEAREAKNYFKLYRSLLDTTQNHILGDPKLLRLWLYCLGHARAFPDETGEPGAFILNPPAIQEDVGVDQMEMERMFGLLESKGSIRRTTLAADLTEVVIRNWDYYQNQLCRKSGQTGNGSTR